MLDIMFSKAPDNVLVWVNIIRFLLVFKGLKGFGSNISGALVGATFKKALWRVFQISINGCIGFRCILIKTTPIIS